MPRVRTGTIAGHRREVHDAILDAAAHTIGARGLQSLTMAGLAQEAGIGRATLYKYFAGVDEVLVAWHERLLDEHVRTLHAEVDGVKDPAERLVRGLQTYARLSAHEPSAATGALHAGDHARGSAGEVEALFADLLRSAATHGSIRDDVAAPELAVFCLGALDGARHLRSQAAVRRLVATVLDGLRFEGSMT